MSYKEISIPSITAGESDPCDRERSGRPISRRDLLKGASAIAAGYVGIKLLEHGPEIVDSVSFENKRRMPERNSSYLPRDPEHILPQEQSDALYEKLHLQERFPTTLNKNAFHSVSQRVTRLSTLYYHPDNNLSPEEQEEKFYQFNEGFFQNMLQTADFLQTDFAGTLLMFQVSGANTASVRTLKQDVWEERVRVGMTIAEDMISQQTSLDIVKGIQKVNTLADVSYNGWYYAMPRLSGPVSLGIHDIETIMITRGLQDLEKSLPEKWPVVEEYLQKRSPDFFKQASHYTDLYAQFDSLSTKIVQDVRTSQEIQAYLRKSYTSEKLKDFLTEKGSIDPYQFIRTTTFWAIVTEFDAAEQTAGAANRSDIVEHRALQATIEYYLAQNDPTSFFLDQIANPKMVQKLTSDSEKGNAAATKLLEKYRSLEKMSDTIIAADRKMANTIERDKLEDDPTFQVVTGVAHSRWLLRDSLLHTRKEQVTDVSFSTPDEVAFHAAYGTANREAAPSYQLAGANPLTRASLTFAAPEKLFQTMDAFIEQVYKKYEPVHPEKDFKTFARYVKKLLDERAFKQKLRTNQYLLEDDDKTGEFITESEKFGAYQTLFSMPFCSWSCLPDATIGYIAEMKRPQKMKQKEE